MKKYFYFLVLATAPLLADDSLPTFDHEESSVFKATDVYEDLFLKTVLALVGLLLVIFLGVILIRKLSSSRTKHMNLLKSVKVLERRPLSPKSVLYLIEVAGRKILLSESQLEVRSIANLDWIEEPLKEPQD